MNPKVKREFVDRLNSQMGRPISSLSFEPMEGSYTAILFVDEPSSGDRLYFPFGTLLIYTPDEVPIDTLSRNVVVAYFY